jgi:hypothetical protein
MELKGEAILTLSTSEDDRRMSIFQKEFIILVLILFLICHKVYHSHFLIQLSFFNTSIFLPLSPSFSV